MAYNYSNGAAVAEREHFPWNTDGESRPGPLRLRGEGLKRGQTVSQIARVAVELFSSNENLTIRVTAVSRQ